MEHIMKEKWEKKGDFAIKIDFGNHSSIVLERRVEYKNLNLNEVISKIALLGYKDKSLRLHAYAKDEKNFLILKQKYEDAGFGVVDLLDECCKHLCFNINSTETQKILVSLDFLQKIESIDFVYNDIKTTLNLKPTHKEVYSQLIKEYESDGIKKVFTMAKEAVSNGYDEAYFVLAKHAQQLDKLDDVVDFLMETKDIQSSEATEFRFEFAHFIYTASPENQRQALKILLITKNEYAAELRTQIYNELSGLYGTTYALEALDIDVETVMLLGDATCSLSKDNNKLSKENEELKRQLEELKMLLPKSNTKFGSNSPTLFKSSDNIIESDENISPKLIKE